MLKVCVFGRKCFLGKNLDITNLIKNEYFMKVAKEQIQQIILENNISNIADVNSFCIRIRFY